jgi:hypothetical protein
MNAVNGLIAWTTSPDKGSLKTGMRDSSLLHLPGAANVAAAAGA